ncbi:MAG: TetR/AcrR family transcriptional regulator [Comamonadaceae bacterium]|nr:TetR/AcrR family transcriptional regulator [Comamonadaceae bacterium]
MARRAGVSKGTLYLYYPSKEELFKAVMRRRRCPTLIAEGAELAEAYRGLDGASCCRLLGRIWWQQHRQPARPPACTSVIAGRGAQLPRAAAASTPTRSSAPADQLFARVVQRGIDRGEFRAAAGRRRRATR